MKLALWYWSRRGGARYTLELAQAFKRRSDIELFLLLSKRNELLSDFVEMDCRRWFVDTYQGMPSFVLASLRLPLLKRQLARYISDQRIETVISTMPHPWSWYLASAIAPTGAKLVSIIHDARVHPGDSNTLLRFRLGRELAAAAGVVTLSESVRSGLRFSGPLSVIPHGPFSWQSDAPGPRRYPKNRPFRFLFFGRILAYKGMGLLLQAYDRLAVRRDDIELWIVGSGNLRPYAALLNRLPRVAVINRWIPESMIGGFFQEADAVVTPYIEASQSGVLAVAMGTGLPSVVTPVGGLIEQIEPGASGIMARAPTPEALAEAMAQLLDPPLYEHLAKGAGIRNGSQAWDRIADDFMRHFRGLRNNR